MTQGSVTVKVYHDGVKPDDPDLDNQIKFQKKMHSPVGFGEIALLYNSERTASIFADEKCTVYRLDGKLFKAVIIKSNMDRRAV